MNTIALALALVASISSTPAGIISLGRIGTVVPVSAPRISRTHIVQTPTVRFVSTTPGCITRTLARDGSGQTVTYCL